MDEISIFIKIEFGAYRICRLCPLQMGKTSVLTEKKKKKKKEGEKKKVVLSMILNHTEG